MNALFLAFAHLRFHWGRSLVMVLVGALILSVPLVSQTLLAGGERALTARADATPLVLGRRGSQLDLVMSAVYFADAQPQPVSQSAEDAVWDSDLGLPVPLFTPFSSNGARIVGTSLDYFDFRGLTLREGRRFAVLGEAVLGARVAARLGLGPGDTVVSAPQSLFDLDGVYPLELRITGVLAPTGSADDEVILTDVKTTWVIAGIGHGHDDVISAADIAAGNVAANAAIVQYNRITDDNIDGFHFHGDPGRYPLTAVLVEPWDTRSATMLKGRYLDPDNPLQVAEPARVVAGLVERIFRIKALLDAVTVIVGAAALAAMALALFLAWRLRAPEMTTAWRLGAGRWVIARLALAEIVLLFAASTALAAVIVMAVTRRGDDITSWLLALGA